MRPKNFKGGRCIKSKLKKCDEVARTYDKIQTAYAEVLDRDKNIEKIKCNVLLENLEDGEFTTDFLCTKTNGDLMVRECVFRKKLSLPRTCKLLDASRKYWARDAFDPNYVGYAFFSDGSWASEGVLCKKNITDNLSEVTVVQNKYEKAINDTWIRTTTEAARDFTLISNLILISDYYQKA